MIDSKKLGIRQGVDLSCLTSEQQSIVYDVITELGVSLSWDDSTRYKEAGKKGYLNADYLKDILTHEKTKTRKLLYGLMLDRMSLSARSGWFDDENRVFIKYALKSIMEDLNCSKRMFRV